MILNSWGEEMKRLADELRKRHYVDMVADMDRMRGVTVRFADPPANNDGRRYCYWCGAPTKSVGCTATLMQVCTVCGK